MGRKLWSACVVGLLALVAWWRFERPRGERGESPAQPEASAPDTEPELMLHEGGAAQARAPVASVQPAPPAPESAPPSDPECVITGMVLEPSGAPARRALVYFVWDDRGRARESHAHSDADGRFELVAEACGARGARGDVLASVHRHAFAPVAQLGVAAGARGLELRLGWAAFFELEVRDAEERPIERVFPSFSWMLAGHPVPDNFNGSQGSRWASSPVPFLVYVQPSRHRRETFGPFEPAQVGERLVLHVEALPVVRGTVTHADLPVPGAEVQLELVLPRGPDEMQGNEPWVQQGRADANGRFEFLPPRAARLELSAFALPHGEGRSGPLEFDGTHDLDGLEIELARRPGTIVGQITLPAGHRPSEVWLSVDRGGGGYRPLRPDGSFVLPDLPPGRRWISLEEGLDIDPTHGERWLPLTDGPTLPPAWLQPEPRFEVELPPGETVRCDIDLARPAPCSLRGVLRLDGQVRSLSPESVLETERDPPAVVLDRGSRATVVSATDLDESGNFTLSAGEPGPYRLRADFELDGARDERWQVEDRVALRAGTETWALAVRTGSLRLLPPDAAHPLWSTSPLALWRGPDELRVVARHPALDDEHGTRFFRFLPAGTVTLREERDDEPPRELECEIRAGETTEVRWPQ